MTILLKFPNMRRIREVATAWIVRIERELSEQELQALQQWLAESPKHREVFLEAARLWDHMGVLTKLSKILPLEDFKPAPSQIPWRRLSAAAAVVAFLAVFLMRPEAVMLRPSHAVPEVSANPIAVVDAPTYRTAVGQQSLVSLSDGTRIRLNTDSLIEVSYSPKSRRIHLVRGEALFEVAKDSSRPFDVRSGDHVVRAVGTAFNVRVSGIPNMEVTVTEGRIRVMEFGAQAAEPERTTDTPGLGVPTAVAGQLVTVMSSGDPRVRELRKEELADRTAWERGVLVFRGIPLREVLKEFSRYTDQKLVPNDDSIGDIPVNGLYRTADVNSLLTGLRQNFGLQTSLVGDTVMLTRGNDAGSGNLP